MKKEMLINVLQPEECRIAIVENGVLEELYVERTSHESYTGNIYKGKVVNLEPAIQAAFVDFSVGRNGFLHVSDVEPQYYDRHQSHGEEIEPTVRPGPGPTSGSRPRDPRRGRDRDDRRRSRPEPPNEAFPPSLPAPPRAEDRNRDRERPDRDRERPDRSVRGRRDRSEMPRRFGEGLGDERDAADQPAAPPPEPTSFEPPASRLEEPAHSPLEAESSLWAETVERDWDPDRERERERERDLERERHREREFRQVEPEEPRWRPGRPAEPFDDPDLPPSRTQRTKLPQPPPSAPENESEERGRHHPAPGVPETHGPEEEREETFGEGLAADPFVGREPRRGRGRPSPPPAPLPSSRPLPGFEEEDLEQSEIEGGPERRLPPAPEEYGPIEGEPRFPEPPRRRGGRAAIRSRGGERGGELERPRESVPPVSPGAERISPGAADADIERYRSSDLEPPAPQERGRAAEPTEFPRERTRPHNRAGEPGYVPRRERLRSVEQGPGEEPPPPAYGWSARHADLDPDIESREFLAADEEPLGQPGPAASQADAREGKRRRRRRGRRRERERPELEAAAPAGEEFPSDFDDLGPEPGYVPSFPRRLPEERLASDEVDELDLDIENLEDVDDAEDMAIDEEDEIVDDLRAEPARVAEEEIDPELEQEIRKEIEEIEELEREMGLRGPVEARPGRGDDLARGGRSGRGRGMVKPPIQEIFRRGDEVLVQVIKESIGTKGPTLSTYISIPGRYLVLMPGLNRVGVSRKIVDEGQRRKLREIMHELNPPKGLGFIVRTAGLERTKRELARDLAYLLRLWKVILRRIKRTRTPGPIYQESDLITRTIRDIFTSEIDTIWIDEPSAFERAQEFLRVVMPRFVNRIKLYDEKVPLFHKYGIEDEIAKIQRRHVPLPEGGSIVIDQTEALVAIDVNSGNFRVEDDAEKTAYEMNLRAAKEIARQLRLRDLGGVIVNDFIDMREERHSRGVERALREAIKRDRARTKVLRMSAFGLIEMTRQRIRPSLKRSVYEDCPHCTGAGVVKTAESMAIDVTRILALASHREDIRRINITVSPSVATYLNNRKRKEIAKIESESSLTIQVTFKENVPAEFLQIDCYDANSSELRLFPLPAPSHKRGH
ncbi:MAG: Rne/Rng family ribonuclease [Isosphaeraceae bacterium]